MYILKACVSLKSHDPGRLEFKVISGGESTVGGLDVALGQVYIDPNDVQGTVP